MKKLAQHKNVATKGQFKNPIQSEIGALKSLRTIFVRIREFPDFWSDLLKITPNFDALFC